MAAEIQLPRVAQSLDYTCGAACFESMFIYLNGNSPGELFFAQQLGTLELGYTQPERICQLAVAYGFEAHLAKSAHISDIILGLEQGKILFVTWWDEDAGHYSLVKSIDQKSIVLMDPLTAREGLDNRLPTVEFESHWQKRGSILITVGKKT